MKSLEFGIGLPIYLAKLAAIAVSLLLESLEPAGEYVMIKTIFLTGLQVASLDCSVWAQSLQDQGAHYDGATRQSYRSAGSTPAPSVSTEMRIDTDMSVSAPRVANNSALALSAASSGTVIRESFADPGDGGRASYRYSSKACSKEDGGSKIQSKILPGCWLIDENFLTPQMFGAKGDGSTDDGPAIAAWSAAGAALNISMWMPGKAYYENSPWHLTETMSVTADINATLTGGAGAPTCIEVGAGNYTNRYLLPALSCSTGIKLLGSSQFVANIPFIGTGTTAVQIDSGGTLGSGTLSASLDNVITVGSIFNETYGVKINCANSIDVMQGNRVEANFITTTAKPFAFTGVACSDDGNSLTANAIDITADKGGGALISNEQAKSVNANGPNVPRASLVVKEWAGGNAFLTTGVTGATAQLIKGNFSQLNFDIRTALNIVAADQIQSSLSCFECEIKLHQQAGFNAAIAATTISGNLAGFNGGNPVALDGFIIKFTTPTALTSGDTQDFYVYPMFNDYYTYPFSATKVNGISNLSIVGTVDQSTAVDHQLLVRLGNFTNATTAAGEVVYVRFSRN